MPEKPLVQQFQDEIQAVVDKYKSEGISLTLSEAVGALELVKMDLYSENNPPDLELDDLL